jgi:hypothetical protein
LCGAPQLPATRVPAEPRSRPHRPSPARVRAKSPARAPKIGHAPTSFELAAQLPRLPP